MSTFIDRADYATAINGYILDQIVQFDDTKLDVVETQVIQEMTGYLNARYDTAAIFATTGGSRNPLVVMYAVDMSLYYLHRLINPKKVPDFRKERYQYAIEWLEKVQKQTVNPDLPPLLSTQKDYMFFNSNPKRTNHL